jgi:putative ABC transport system ATP-binding protein
MSRHARTDEAAPIAPVVVVEDLHRSYGSGPTAVHALRGVSFTAQRGELVAIVGRSGSGKTTLLNFVAGLEQADAGRVTVAGTEVTALDEDGRDGLRGDGVSMILQGFGLVAELSATENVGLPLRLQRWPSQRREQRVATLLELVGLDGHAAHRPEELSGGQMQRVAVARALAASPTLLVADEPTGQLDTDTGLAVMALIRGVVEAEGMTALLSTHDPVMIALADRVLHLEDGRLTGA